MKVITSLSQTYDSLLPFYEKLKIKVDSIIAGKKQDQWHYQSRIKSRESFALKIETGRYSSPSDIDDFLGCTIVVENSTKINDAIQLIENQFNIESRKPKKNEVTHKKPDAFPFDDLRLYSKFKNDTNQPEIELSKYLFEIQIKTFLQHAWTIATHDLIYKADDICWSKQRIAYQVKAMLEHAELSIGCVHSLSTHSSICLQTSEIEELLAIKKLIECHWLPENFPKGILRMLENVRALLHALDLKIDDLNIILNKEATFGRGAKTLNLSPYLTIIKSIYNQTPDKIVGYLTKKTKKKFNIFLPPELDIHFGVSPAAVMPAGETPTQNNATAENQDGHGNSLRTRCEID